MIGYAALVKLLNYYYFFFLPIFAIMVNTDVYNKYFTARSGDHFLGSFCLKVVFLLVRAAFKNTGKNKGRPMYTSGKYRANFRHSLLLCSTYSVLS